MFAASFQFAAPSCAGSSVLLFTASSLSFAASRAFADDASAAPTNFFETIVTSTRTPVFQIGNGMDWRQPLCVALLVVTSVGFSFLHYPWAGECLAWDLAFGLLSVAATLEAGFAIGPIGARIFTCGAVMAALLADTKAAVADDLKLPFLAASSNTWTGFANQFEFNHA